MMRDTRHAPVLESRWTSTSPWLPLLALLAALLHMGGCVIDPNPSPGMPAGVDVLLPDVGSGQADTMAEADTDSEPEDVGEPIDGTTPFEDAPFPEDTGPVPQDVSPPRDLGVRPDGHLLNDKPGQAGADAPRCDTIRCAWTEDGDTTSLRR